MQVHNAVMYRMAKCRQVESHSLVVNAGFTGGQCWMEALFQVWWVQTPPPAMYGKVQHLRLYARLLTMVNGQCSTPVAW